MNSDKTKHAVKNTVSGLVYKLLRIIMQFVIRTILILKLGMEYAGLNSLFTSILQVLSFSELGFASVIAFTMYKPIVDEDEVMVRALLNFVRKVYYVVGAVILVAGCVLMPFLPNLISGSYPSDINLYLLYLIYLGNTVISYLFFAYKRILLTAYQRSDVENRVMTFCEIVMYVAQIAALLLYPNYYVYIIFLPLCTLGINFVCYYRVNKLFPSCKAEGNLSRVQQKAIYKHIFSLVGHRISIVVVNSFVSIIVSATLGLELLAIYNNYYYVINSCMAIMIVVYTSITAGVGTSMASESVQKNYNDFKTLTFVNVWMVGFMAIAILCLFQPFMVLWLGEESLLPDYSAFLFVLLFYFWRFKDMVSTFKDAGGLWKEDFWKPYTISLVSLVLALVLVRIDGINGVIYSLIVGVFIISMPWETHALFKAYFKIKTGAYYLRMLIYTAIVFAVGALTYYVCSLLPTGGIWWFMARAGICCVIPNILFLLFSFKTREFKVVWGKLNTLLKRRRSVDEESNRE